MSGPIDGSTMIVLQSMLSLLLLMFPPSLDYLCSPSFVNFSYFFISLAVASAAIIHFFYPKSVAAAEFGDPEHIVFDSIINQPCERRIEQDSKRLLWSKNRDAMLCRSLRINCFLPRIVPFHSSYPPFPVFPVSRQQALGVANSGWIPTKNAQSSVSVAIM